MLKAAGKDVVVLNGGYNGWVESILNPKLSQNVNDDEILKYKCRKFNSFLFRGERRGTKGGAEKDKKEPATAAEPTKSPAKKKGKVGGC